MKKMRVKHTFISLMCIFLASFISAADLPQLPQDPAVMKGALPNGMTYYIVSNPSSKGVADFALAQRTGCGTSSDIMPVALSKAVLAELPHIGGGVSPQKFFSSNGATPTTDGFVKVDAGSTVYRFSDMLVSKPAVLDSALVVLVGMADRLAQGLDPNERKWYSASDNAIIISGDVDAKSVASKLGMLSYLTPSSASQPRGKYVWASHEAPLYEVKETSSRLSEITAEWRAPRVPDKYVGTLQPYIQKMYVAQLGETAVSRIKDELNKSGIPSAGVSYRHISSSEVSGDETFTVSLSVDAQYFADAVSVLAQTMSALETSGASGEELELARRRYIGKLAASLERPVKDNAAYIDLCVNSFLLGLPVVNDVEVIKAYTSRSIELEKEKALFRDVADALLDPHRDFVLRCSSPEGMDSSKVKELFEKGWQAGKESSLPRSISVADTLMSVVSAPKVSIKSAKKDPMSGGVEWRFSNGFKVVYRKMDTAGKIHWSMGLGGGFGSIQDLERGEGAFVGDMLKLYRVAGMNGDDFWKFLELRNIDMNVRVGLAAVFLSGSVQTENFRVMLRSLAALANERTLDRDAVATYVKNENLRLVAQAGTIEDRKAAMDSLMCPDYKYSQIKSRGKLTERLADKADRFYEERFSAMNDGVLVLAGDIDETVLKKELLAMVGMFRTRKSAFYRPSVRYQPVSGWSTHTVDGNENSVYIALSVPMPLAAEDKMASEIAAMVLKRSLSSAIQKTGMSVDISSNTRIYPQERFNVMISLKEASADGFAEGVEHGGALEALRILRTTLRSLETTEVTDVVVKAYKEWLKNDITYRMKSPQYWVNAISMRQIEGKDFSTDYKARVDAVTRDKVKQIITSLNNASKVEYIIRK